jgi:hypothetical protein
MVSQGHEEIQTQYTASPYERFPFGWGKGIDRRVSKNIVHVTEEGQPHSGSHD